MGVIVRKVVDARPWSAEAPSAEDERATLDDFLRRETDTDGLSVYEVENDEDRRAVLGAFAAARGNTKPIDLIEVDRAFIEQFGTVTPTSAESPILSANALHRSLDWPQKQLHALARALLEARTPTRRHKPSEVKAALRGLRDEDVAPEYLDFVRKYRT